MQTENSDSVKLARGTSIVLAGRVIGRALDILSQMILARMLAPKAFGLYAIGWTVFRMVGAIAALGLDNGVVHYASRSWKIGHSEEKNVLLQAISLAVLSGLVIGGGVYCIAPWLAEYVFRDVELVYIIRRFALAFFLYSGLKVVAVATTISQKMQYATYATDITQPIVNCLLILVFSTMGLGLPGAVAATICSFAAAFILAGYHLGRMFPELFFSRIRLVSAVSELLSYSLPTLFAGTLTLCILWMDRLLVAYFLTPTEVGIYHAAAQLAMIFASILDALGTAFSPMIARCFHEGQIERLDELFKISTKWGLYCSLPLFLVMVVVPQQVMEVLFGKQYEHGAFVLSILAVSQLINVGTGLTSRLLILTGHQNRWLFLSATTLGGNTLLSFLLIPMLGVIGAALSSACAMGGLFLGGLYQVWRSVGIWPYDVRYRKGIIAAVITAGVLLLFHSLKVEVSALYLLLLLAVSVGIFTSLLIIFGLDNEERELLHALGSQYRRKDKARLVLLSRD